MLDPFGFDDWRLSPLRKIDPLQAPTPARCTVDSKVFLLQRVPVGLMFFEGAPRLLASPVTIPHLKEDEPECVVVEAYPGVLARALIGRGSYKNDTRKQTADQHEARLSILQELRKQASNLYGFAIEADENPCDDPGADHLHALLCAVQAAWA